MSERASLGLDNYFTPHITVDRRMPSSGSLPIEVVHHATLSLAPSTLALRYGQTVSEGMKAYACPAGSASLFKPYQCAARFNRSATRLSTPTMREEMFIEACVATVDLFGNRVTPPSSTAAWGTP